MSRLRFFNVSSQVLASALNGSRCLARSPAPAWRIRACGRSSDHFMLRQQATRFARLISNTARKIVEEKGKERPVTLDDKPKLIDTTKALQQRMKERLSVLSTHENIYTVPNFLTVTRLIAAPVVGYLILHGHPVYAVALFAYAGITDLVDGWIARKWKLQTVVGSVIDPMADKALMTIVVVCMAIKGALPLWFAAIILGRDISLAIAAIYYRYASLPAPKTLIRYWDFSLPSAEVHPTTVSKYNTALQLVVIGTALTLPALSNDLLAPIGVTTEQLASTLMGMSYLVAATTVWSGGSYVWRKDVVKILGDDELLKKKQGFRGRAILGISLASFVVLAGILASRQQISAKDLDPEQDI